MRNGRPVKHYPIEGEVWKDVVGFEGLYSVSNKNRVKSLFRNDIAGHLLAERILKPGFHPYGYLKFTLSKDGKLNYKLLHRLVAEAFLPNPQNLPVVNHIDNDPKNNAPENLEWCTHRHNSRQAYRHQRLTKVGESNHMAKLTAERAMQIFNSPGTLKEIGENFGVSTWAVSDIKTGRRWYMITGKRHPSVKARICEAEKPTIYIDSYNK